MTNKAIIIIIFLSFIFPCCLSAQEKLKEAVVSAKIPKRLRTFEPFWGVPVPNSGESEESQASGSFLYSRKDSTSIPRWFCWNLDLVSLGDERYKFSQMMPASYKPQCVNSLKTIIDECYRWAWRKPYGNTCVSMGPLYSSKNPNVPYAWYVAVCKKESNEKPLSLGFSSIAFLIPADKETGPCNIYKYSLSVNAVEYHSGYNLFPKLPSHIQEQVEELTGYELFCPFQELDDNLIENLYVEFEHDIEQNVEVTIE